MKEEKEKTVESIRSELQRILDIQLRNGNWNYDAYMHGLANGLIMAMSIICDDDPKFLDAPDIWRYEWHNLEKIMNHKAVKIDL